MSRVRLYIDGYNFYYAVKHGDFPIGLGWCDFRKLAEQYLIGGAESLDGIKYFTARVTGRTWTSEGEERRQRRWLAAVGSISGLEIIYGFHQQHEWKRREEKQTDVNIAVELLVDAVEGGCDRAILITGDIDQAPAVRAARERLPIGRRLEVDVWVPPGLSFERWREEAGRLGMNCREITPEMLRNSRLPDVIRLPTGGTVECLKEWRMPKEARGRG